MTNICIFLGPSLRLPEARLILPDAVFKPPARVGDIYNAVCNNYSVIGLIDGYFDAVPSPWHKEILYGLSQGVHIFGAASLGALRAAETYEFGMVGIGTVFEWYKKGYTVDDDEVAVAHQPEEKGYRSMSETLVNVRYVVSEAVKAGIIDHSFADLIVSKAKKIFYAERTWYSILDQPPRDKHKENEALRKFQVERKLDVKADDARMLLHKLAEFTADEVIPFKANFTFEPTVFWRRLTRTISEYGVESTTHEQLYRIARFSRWHERILCDALLRELIERESDRLGVELPQGALRKELEEFRREKELLSKERLLAWMNQRNFDKEDILNLMRIRCLEREMYEIYPSILGQRYLSALRCMDDCSYIIEPMRKLSEIYVANGSSYPSCDEIGVTLKELLSWYERYVRQIIPDLETHALRLGFSSAVDFLGQLALLFEGWRDYPDLFNPILANNDAVTKKM